MNWNYQEHGTCWSCDTVDDFWTITVNEQGQFVLKNVGGYVGIFASLAIAKNLCQERIRTDEAKKRHGVK